MPRPGVFTYALDPDEKVVYDDQKRITGVKSGERRDALHRGDRDARRQRGEGRARGSRRASPAARRRIASSSRGTFAPGETRADGRKGGDDPRVVRARLRRRAPRRRVAPFDHRRRDVGHRREPLALRADRRSVDRVRDARRVPAPEVDPTAVLERTRARASGSSSTASSRRRARRCSSWAFRRAPS